MDCVPRPPARKHWFYPTNTCTHVRKLEVSLPILVESYVEGWNCNATQCNQVQVGVQGINPKVPRRDSLAVDARQIRQTGTASEGGHVCPGQGAKSRFPGCGNLHISQTNIGQMHRFNPIWPNLAPTWRNLAPSWTRLGCEAAAKGLAWVDLGPTSAQSDQVVPSWPLVDLEIGCPPAEFAPLNCYSLELFGC